MTGWDVGQIQVKLQQLAEEQRERTLGGLEDACEHVRMVSDGRVPYDDGELHDSSKVTIDKRRMIGAISYRTWYGIIQHENLKLQHKDGRQAKFLESALYGEVPRITEIIRTAAHLGESSGAP